MNPKPSVKHFLDSSVVRPMLLGTKAYQQYFESQFDEKYRYISPYIAMEIKRSYLRNVIKFYFTLRLPTIETVADAITFWSNHFQGSKHKAIEQLVAQLLTQEAFSGLNPLDKDQALAILGAYIRQFMTALISEFTTLDANSPQCTRAVVPLFFDTPDLAESLKAFIDDFDDLQTCREQCRIAEFLLEDNRNQLESYLKQAESLQPSAQNRGFIKITENIADIFVKGATACSCKRCERIGDLIIALDAPRDMQIEHTDNAFNYLCPPLNQLHRQHPSETQIINH